VQTLKQAALAKGVPEDLFDHVVDPLAPVARPVGEVLFESRLV
jgi:hypothetical protein